MIIARGPDLGDTHIGAKDGMDFTKAFRSYFINGYDAYKIARSNARNAVDVLDKAIADYGASGIIKDGQYTCHAWMKACRRHSGMKVSMDECARCLDNVCIERFWRTIKREYVPNTEDNAADLRRGIADFIDYYNNRRYHQGIGHRILA